MHPRGEASYDPSTTSFLNPSLSAASPHSEIVFIDAAPHPGPSSKNAYGT